VLADDLLVCYSPLDTVRQPTHNTTQNLELYSSATTLLILVAWRCTYFVFIREALLRCNNEKNVKKDGQHTFKRNTEAPPRSHFFLGKAISVTYSGCVFVVLFIQHAKRMRRIVSLSVACAIVQYFPTLFHQRRYFVKNVLNIKYAFWFSHKFCPKHFWL